MPTTTNCVASIAAIALIASGCGQQGLSADDLNKGTSATGGMGASAGTGVPMGGTSAAAGGSVATGGAAPTGGTGGAGATGGAAPLGGTAGEGMTGGAAPLGGSGGADPTGGSAGSGMETGGSAGVGMGGTAGSGGGTGPIGPYDPRSGSFKMLIYSRTGPGAFRHGSIPAGIQMLQQIATEQGFQATATEANTDITVAGLSQYEIVFFMNSTGDIFNTTEQAAFQEWMTTKNGAFAGVHSATDTEEGWAFYSEVTGQYYNGHGAQNTPGGIQFDAAMLNHPALRGLPNPWQRNEEWYLFNNFQQWSTKPGFQMLGRKQSDNQPIMWIREWSNFRSFYTAIGHDTAVFQDANVKKHVTGGIMWAVRRDHLIR